MYGKHYLQNISDDFYFVQKSVQKLKPSENFNRPKFLLYIIKLLVRFFFLGS